jgi:hypothetical protein
MDATTPFGNTTVAQVLWKELLKLEKKHREYICTVFHETCKVWGELYMFGISQRNMLSEMMYDFATESSRKYLTGDGYTYFCNILKVQLRKHKKLDNPKK